MNRILEEDH